MATQLTLITVPETPATDEAATDEATSDAGTASTEPVILPRRSADHTGWLDRRTISTGRRGVARARAALADATRRAAMAEAERSSARGAALMREADGFADRSGSHGHAA